MKTTITIILIPLALIAAFVGLILHTHFAMLTADVGAVRGSVGVPIPLFLLALHGYLLALMMIAARRYRGLYIGLLFVLWGAFLSSAIILQRQGIVLPLDKFGIGSGFVVVLFSLVVVLVSRKVAGYRAQNVQQTDELAVQRELYQALCHKVASLQLEEPQQPLAAFLQATNQAIDEHLSDPECDTKTIADKLFMTEKTYSRKLKSHTNMTPASYLKLRRMHQARQYVLAKKYPTQKALALAVGFKSASYFAKQFKQYMADLEQSSK